MDRLLVAQRDFSAGQIDDSALRRDDADIQRAGLRTARNVRLLNTGAMARRPGRRRLFQHGGITERIRPAVGKYWYMTIEAGQITFRDDPITGSQVRTGQPWSGDILSDLRWEIVGGNVIICHPSFRPRVFSYNSTTGIWTPGVFDFAVDQNGAIRQPYYAPYQGQGYTLQPSARSGPIDIGFSGPVLAPQHVGVRFLYVGRQIEITGVTDSQHGTANVIEQLAPTFGLTVDQVQGLQPGDIIEGVNSGAKGVVTIVSQAPPSFQVVLTTNWSGFDLTGGVGGGGEKIAGPRSSMTVQAQLEILGPGPSQDWQEALCSDYRGWPGWVSSDSQRLIFANFKQHGTGIVWSAIGTLNDFLVGPDAADAMFEEVPENCQVLAVVGGADEFVFSDTGVFYVPISATNPLKPGSVEFRNIAKDGCATVAPINTTQGVIFVNPGQTRVLAITQTGQQTQPYLVQDLTPFHASVIRTPVKLAATGTDIATPERYLYVVNADRTVAVGRYDESRKWIGFSLWDSVGGVIWASSAGAEVIFDAQYELGPAIRLAEALDPDMLVDAAQPVDGATWPVGFADVSVLSGTWYRGDYVVAAGGSLPDVPSGLGLIGGYNFEVEGEPFIPQAPEGASKKQRLRKRRLTQIACVVQRSQAIEVAGRLVPFWRAGELEEVAPPVRDETYRTRHLGRAWDPRWSVKQSLPGALTIIEMTTEVTA